MALITYSNNLGFAPLNDITNSVSRPFNGMYLLRRKELAGLQKGLAVAIEPTHSADVDVSEDGLLLLGAAGDMMTVIKQLEDAQAALAAAQLAFEAEAERGGRLERQLEERAAVIGQLARNRDSSLAKRLSDSEHEVKGLRRVCARLVSNLCTVRRQYEELVEGAQRAIAEIEESQDEPCSCADCGGSIFAATALLAFKATGTTAEARGAAAHWQAKALDADFELETCRGALETYRTEVQDLEHMVRRRDAAIFAAQRRVEEADASLAQERAAHLLTRQRLAKAEQEEEQGELCEASQHEERIPACWDPACAAAQLVPDEESTPARPQHRRTRSVVLA